MTNVLRIPVRAMEVLQTVAKAHDLPVEVMLSPSRVRAHVAALREAYALMSQFAEPEQIAAWVGRDLSSVHKGLKRAAALHETRRGAIKARRVVYLSMWRGVVDAPAGRLTMAEIATDIARLYSLTLAQIRGEARDHHACRARNHAAWAMDQQPHLTRAQIGRYLGGRDRTTIDNAISRHEALVERRGAA